MYTAVTKRRCWRRRPAASQGDPKQMENMTEVDIVGEKKLMDANWF